MPGDRKFDLGDYVEVKDRIRILYELYPQARLVTRKVKVLTAPDGKQRVMVHAQAYRSPDDPLPGDGYSWMELPGTTSYTRGSEIENTETSAWGRAIGALGILIDRSIATAQEVDNKQREIEPESTVTSSDAYRETEELLGDFTGTGIVRLGTAEHYKLEARQGPDGHVIGFKMEFKDEANIPQVQVLGPAGEALFLATSMNPGSLRDSRLRVKGRLYSIKSNRSRQSWKRLVVTEWENHEMKFPAAEEPPLPGPPDDVALVGEAPSEPLGLVS